ncbi:hypothetical protein GT755_35350 [Herbidospora sp. NEAU-GS84]|uniref:Sigma-70 family RNA polymerase sigma factor n=1 Tax=Herbidospora solisilvae TaxID=2696284 RepID=A0A7C9NBY6_9ACTN|nr:sigma-70 family RNA polymerase sigma factor [Herbidospora solisilvae]NAS26933.1 hypothetical protein [Herbidospora solisilvae]
MPEPLLGRAPDPRARRSPPSIQNDVHSPMENECTDQLEHVMNMHFGAIGRYLATKGYDSAAIEDARQYAFIQSWGKMKAGDWHTIENPGAWLKKVALRHASRSNSPARRRELPLALHEQALTTDDFSEEVIADLITEEAIRSLDPMSRIVATMDRDGFTSHEMARCLSISEQKVRDLRKRYLKQLRRFFLKQSAGEVGG